MRAETFNFSKTFDQFGRKILRVRGGKPYPFNTLNLGDFSEELWKCYVFKAAVMGLAIRIYILAQKGHLFDSLICQSCYFCNDVIMWSACFPATGVWNNAVRAEVIASLHDGDKLFKGFSSCGMFIIRRRLDRGGGYVPGNLKSR